MRTYDDIQKILMDARLETGKMVLPKEQLHQLESDNHIKNWEELQRKVEEFQKFLES